MKKQQEVVIASRKYMRPGETDGVQFTVGATPLRILVPHECKIEIFACPEGTEINIVYGNKRKPAGEYREARG